MIKKISVNIIKNVTKQFTTTIPTVIGIIYVTNYILSVALNCICLLDRKLYNEPYSVGVQILQKVIARLGSSNFGSETKY